MFHNHHCQVPLMNRQLRARPVPVIVTAVVLFQPVRKKTWVIAPPVTVPQMLVLLPRVLKLMAYSVQELGISVGDGEKGKPVVVTPAGGLWLTVTPLEICTRTSRWST